MRWAVSVIFNPLDTAQNQAFMDNAINVAGNLQLALGISLSSSQLAALDRDIVWMEERPIHGFIGDTLESATDLLLNQFGIQTGISKKVETLQNNGIAWEIYLHSQGNLIAKAGANTNNTYHSYGAPLPSTEIRKIFNVKANKNDGDFVANPLNIFWIPNWFEPGHGTENYGAAKEKFSNTKE